MILSSIEKRLFLKSVELFKLISDDDLVWIAEITQNVHFDAGEQFLTQGEHGDCVYITMSGKTDILIDGVGKVATLGEREVIGEMAVLSDRLRTASCIAVTEVTALKIVRRRFIEFLRERPESALGIIQVLARRLKTHI